jgi:manganese transport protein
MPHAIHLHSGLTQARVPARNDSEKQKIVRASNHEVFVALAIAGLVNMAMVMTAARSMPDTATSPRSPAPITP